jgi:RimJ/RimL family protein N-acetyltransferase
MRRKEMRGSEDIPVIETERLRMRGHRVADFEECTAMWAAAEVTRYTTGKPQTREEVWARLLRYLGHWNVMGFGYWAIEEKAIGQFVGELGFVDWKREVDPSIEGMAEMGWILAPRTHGRGYATEAARAAIAWSEKNLDGMKVVCMIDPSNAPSLRVAEKIGFREYARTSYKGMPTILFER